MLSAKFPGTCPLCNAQVAPGDPIGRWMGSWAHRACVEGWRQFESNQLKILSGQTFAGHKPSDWKRKPASKAPRKVRRFAYPSFSGKARKVM